MSWYQRWPIAVTISWYVTYLCVLPAWSMCRIEGYGAFGNQRCSLLSMHLALRVICTPVKFQHCRSSKGEMRMLGTSKLKARQFSQSFAAALQFQIKLHLQSIRHQIFMPHLQEFHGTFTKLILEITTQNFSLRLCGPSLGQTFQKFWGALAGSAEGLLVRYSWWVAN